MMGTAGGCMQQRGDKCANGGGTGQKGADSNGNAGLEQYPYIQQAGTDTYAPTAIHGRRNRVAIRRWRQDSTAGAPRIP